MATNGNHTNGTASALVTSGDEFLTTTFDFVICGGGTAGLVLAARLTENPDITVGVLEAGENKLGDVFVDTPAMYTAMFGKEEYDWKFLTTPQKGNHDKIHHIVRGKMLGGSSGINYMMYVRGSDKDYDDWAELVGDKRWSSTAMKKYMRKHQTLEPYPEAVLDRSTMPFVGEHHGTDGPVKTSFNDTKLPIEDSAIKALDEVAGFENKPIDPYSGDHLGFYNTLGSVIRTGKDKGKRSYATRGYFEPNQSRPNLKVLCSAVVSKVVLDSSNKATSVAFSHGGKQYEVPVRKEVIISAGAIQSPQLLELSGIGNPEILQAAGVECKVNLPGVGENLSDHDCSTAIYGLKPGIASLDDLKNPDNLQAAAKILEETSGGPLSCIQSTQGFVPYQRIASPEEVARTAQSIRSTKTKSDFQKRQLELVARHVESDISASLQVVVLPVTADFESGVEDQSVLYTKRPNPGEPGGLALVMLLSYPASRGSVHIKDSNPDTHPTLDPAYLSHPADTAQLSASLSFFEKTAANPHLSQHLVTRIHPPPSVDLSDQAARDAHVQRYVMGTYHPIGSCAMGDVLDGDLRVKGVQGLRVVDASVFPNHISGNICSSVYAVAENAADIIKDAYASYL